MTDLRSITIGDLFDQQAKATPDRLYFAHHTRGEEYTYREFKQLIDAAAKGLMAIGIGLSINNARAVIEALLGRQSDFKRTPKYNLRTGEKLATRRYRMTINRDTWIELALAVHFAIAAEVAMAK